MGVYGRFILSPKYKKIIICNIWDFIIDNKIMNIINLLLVIYSIGFLIIAYFGIIGTLETIEYQNNNYKKNEVKTK
jgi:hypothetical protein